MAAHEAGHAAIALSLGVPVSRVCLTPGKPDTGFCMTLSHPQWRLEDALVDAGGPAADVISGRYSDRWLRHVPRQWSDDFASMRKLGFRPKECRLLVGLAASLLRTSVRDLHVRVTEALLERDLVEADLQRLTLGMALDD